MQQLFPGLDQAVIFQAYKACDSNEEMTVNLLMDNPASFMDWNQRVTGAAVYMHANTSRVIGERSFSVSNDKTT